MPAGDEGWPSWSIFRWWKVKVAALGVAGLSQPRRRCSSSINFACGWEDRSHLASCRTRSCKEDEKKQAGDPGEIGRWPVHGTCDAAEPGLDWPLWPLFFYTQRRGGCMGVKSRGEEKTTTNAQIYAYSALPNGMDTMAG